MSDRHEVESSLELNKETLQDLDLDTGVDAVKGGGIDLYTPPTMNSHGLLPKNSHGLLPQNSHGLLTPANSR